MPRVANQDMGKVTATMTVTNLVDQILAQRGFIPEAEIRAVTLDDVLVDTGATRLCLPEDIIQQLGLTLLGEIEAKIAVGTRKVWVFKGLTLTLEGREGTFNCVELHAGEDLLIGLIPLEDLGLEPDLQNQRLRSLPMEGRDTYLTIL